ncbi:EAL domain-containing protein [Marinobacter sp. MDS2]|uniref:EAL domain-containing protein n=1 Tax=Marinobacter sp. MDS2 TaxID=3065961 RepID=UPI00273B9C78|nr:EAL domain-containing protein [Marinobacter sp. MDS2]MDP4547605.1 EAL domain-containing protein [Marinobacter sp. MDS2]
MKLPNSAQCLAILLLVLATSSSAFAAKAPYIPEMDYVRLAPDAEVTASRILETGRWQRLPEKTANFGYTQDQIWLRFTVSNPASTQLVEISYPALDHIDLYVFENGELIQKESTGDQNLFAERAVQHPLFLFPLQLQAEGHYTILVRAQTQGAMQIPLKLWDRQQYFEHASIETQLHAGYYGILLTVICFNLFVFLALREPVYLLYVLSTLGYLILIASLNGSTYQLLWPRSPDIQSVAMAVVVPLAVAFSCMFSAVFLRLKQSSPFLNRILMLVIGVNLGLAAYSLFGDYSTAIRLDVAFAIPSCLFLTILGPIQWYKGNPQASYYTLAWGALTLGSAITGANKMGFIPNSFLTAYGMQIGSVLEALLLNLALASRLYHERQDKLTARDAEIKALEARRSAELKLMDQALHYPLTGLPNRSSFEMLLNELIHSNPGKRYGVVLLHLNNLDPVTKTLGHRNTDAILMRASKHFNAVARDVPGAQILETNSNANFYLAHFDPQTFACIVDANQTAATQRKLIQSLDEIRWPIEFLGMEVPLEPRIGIAVHPENGNDANTLIRRAAIAEGSGRAIERGLAFYKPSRDSYSADRLTLVSELRHAIDNDELALHLQPKLALKTREIIGFEALLRWRGREQSVFADEIIAVAEQSGLIKPLTRWVISEALKMRGSLVDLGSAASIAVNISPNNLREPDFALFVRQQMENNPSHLGAIIFEVTETSMMQDPANSLKALNSLNKAGIPLSIDDFGSGYSSLSYIKQLPASEIKIDRSLITDLSDRKEDRVIVQTTISMCHNLGYTVVAEGVEDEATLNLLAEMGCDQVQGYFLTRPLPFDKMVEWLADQPCRSRISAS